MTHQETRSGPVPPGFVMAEYLRELPPELTAPLQLLFTLRTCMQRVNAELTRQLGSAALSPGRMQMLMLLWASRGPVQQSELGRHLGISRASMSELVEALEREGQVMTERDPSHGRRILVELTKAGQEGAQAQIHNNARRLSETFGSLTTGEQQYLTALLGRLCEARHTT